MQHSSEKPQQEQSSKPETISAFDVLSPGTLTSEQRGLIRTKASKLRRDAQQRSKKKGIPCTITTAWVRERLQRGVCERTGVPFLFGSPRHPHTPSLDQIEPSQGYTEENTQVVTHRYNCAKGESTDAELYQFACDLVYHIERR